MISFQMVLVDPNSEVRENYHNRKTLWSHKLTSDTYTIKKKKKKDDMKRTLKSDSETSGPSWRCPWTSHLPHL